MSRKNLIIILIVAAGLIAVASITLFRENTNTNTVANDVAKASNTNEKSDISLGNGFRLEQIPAGWKLEGRMEDAVNNVKYGSPATVVTLQPTKATDDAFGPTISIQTFTIDNRLSAREIVNLIQDNNTANKVDDVSEPCLLKSDLLSPVNFDSYEFVENTSGKYSCGFGVTEPGIGQTIVMRQQGSSTALLAIFSVTDEESYDTYISAFEQIARSIQSE